MEETTERRTPWEEEPGAAIHSFTFIVLLGVFRTSHYCTESSQKKKKIVFVAAKRDKNWAGILIDTPYRDPVRTHMVERAYGSRNHVDPGLTVVSLCKTVLISSRDQDLVKPNMNIPRLTQIAPS